MYRLVVRGREVDSYQNLEQALAELRALRASGEDDAAIIKVVNDVPPDWW